MDSNSLVTQIAPPVDVNLAESLFAEFVDIERRFVLGDWEPVTLNGGQFAEIVSRIIYHIDSGNLNRRKGVDPCMRYVEDPDNNNSHVFPGRRASLHLCRVIRTIYKLRSQRGAVHIDPNYTANELDSTLVVYLVRWAMAEMLRIFWNGNRDEVSKVIREIIRYDVPAIFVMDNRQLVLRTDCTAEEEILLLLHNVGESGMTRTEVGTSIPKSPPTITRALKILESSNVRAIIKRVDGRYILTPNGTRRIHEELSGKLSLSN